MTRLFVALNSAIRLLLMGLPCFLMCPPLPLSPGAEGRLCHKDLHSWPWPHCVPPAPGQSVLCWVRVWVLGAVVGKGPSLLCPMVTLVGPFVGAWYTSGPLHLREVTGPGLCLQGDRQPPPDLPAAVPSRRPRRWPEPH